MELAPIVLFVYNRPEHTRACLEYLERNELAAESELYVFADGAKSGSEEAVAAVRRVIAEPWKFKRLNVVERPENKGLAANVIAGVTSVLETHDRVIVLEDDLIVSPILSSKISKTLAIFSFFLSENCNFFAIFFSFFRGIIHQRKSKSFLLNDRSQ